MDKNNIALTDNIADKNHMKCPVCGKGANMQLKPDVEVIFEFSGYRKENLYEGYRPAHLIGKDCLTTGIHSYYNLGDAVEKNLKGTITFISPENYPASLWVGKEIPMYEGKDRLCNSNRYIQYCTV